MHVPASDERYVGSLFHVSDRLDRPTEVLTDIGVANGLAFGDDSRSMYFADTPSAHGLALRHRWRRAFSATGHRSSTSVRARTAGQAGRSLRRRRGVLLDLPACMDLPMARITRLAPWTGSSPLPIRRPTCVAFGGPTLDTLFVTSIGGGRGTTRCSTTNRTGRVFALDVGVTGTPRRSWWRRCDRTAHEGSDRPAPLSRRRPHDDESADSRRDGSGVRNRIGGGQASPERGLTVIGLRPRSRRRARLSSRGRRCQGSRCPRGVPRAGAAGGTLVGWVNCAAVQPPTNLHDADFDVIERGARHRSRRLRQGLVGGGEGVVEQRRAWQHRQRLVGPRPCRLSGLDGVRHRQGGDRSAHTLHRAAVRPAQDPLQRRGARSGRHPTARGDRVGRGRSTHRLSARSARPIR